MTVIIEAIKVADLAEAVAAASTSLPSRPNPPIMGALLIETDQNASTLTLSSYDYNQASRATVTAAAVEADARIAVSGKLLGQVVKVAPKREPLVLDLGPSALVIRAGKTEFTLPLMDVEDYPDLPTVDGEDTLAGRVDSTELIDAIARAGVAAEKSSDANTVRNCVSIVAKEGRVLSVTALHSKMVATTTVDWEPEGDLDVRIVADELSSVLRAFTDGQITIRTKGGLVGLSGAVGDDLRVTSTVSVFDMPYPDWPKLFAMDFATAVDVGDDFAEAVRRASVVAGTALLRLAITAGSIGLSVDGALVDEVAPLGFDGEPVKFNVNPEALRQLLAVVGDKVRLRFTGAPITPMHLGPIDGGPDARAPLSDGGTQCVLMGIRDVQTP